MFRFPSKVPGRWFLMACASLAFPLLAVAQRRGGPDAQFPADRQVFQWLLQHHDQIQREVKDIEGGVETRTESDDAEVAAQIRAHVKAMALRVESGRGIHYRDPLFAALFQQAAHITMAYEPTEKGVLVRETGDTPLSVQLIRAHARVVSSFVERGFAEMHVNHPVPTVAANEPAVDAARPPAGAEGDSPAAISRVFDRLYIPALALTNQGQVSPSRKAVERLAAHWSQTQSLWITACGDAAAGRLLTTAVSDSLQETQRHLDQGACSLAHESLEPIREIMAAARRAAAIDYPLDGLTDFHATMERIVQPAMAMSPEQVDAAYRSEVGLLATQAVLKWKGVAATDFSVLWPEGAAERNGQVRQVQAALDRLQSALAEGDPAALLQAARGLKPPFAKLYMSFGEFP